eukprot:CAMPEP_0115041482 /NCGR_PEP_ID=MMETSP0216-20121206/45548_1 /TAXON_ID=223996 /ORGANISM="Protocruzia adherens, Strain Boccale" /LENGTH=397 /DNA_ID=CAMNT_0002423117 /DNA_START=32 /DNA_END=1222 /DNA_ORIENTATION=-
MDYAIVFLTLLFLALPVFFLSRGKKKPEEETPEEAKEKKHHQHHHHPHHKAVKQAHKPKHQKFKVTHHTPEHAFYCNTIRGISGPVVDFDITPDAKHLVAVCEDKTVRLFEMKSLEEEKPHYWLGKLEYEVPTACGLSYTDNKIAVGIDNENTVVMFEARDKKLHQSGKFKKNAHKTPITTIAYGIDDKCLITCAGGEDTVVKMWSKDGEVIDEYDTNHVQNYRLTKSLNGEMFSVATWMGNPSIVEIDLDKRDGSFKGHEKAMVLAGHAQGVHHIGINQNLTRAVTSCKDKSLTTWKIDVEYKLQEKPRRIQHMTFENHEFTDGHTCEIFSFESGKSIIAISHENKIGLLDEDLKTLDIIPEAHAESIIKTVFRYDEKARILYLLSTAKDGKINIW